MKTLRRLETTSETHMLQTARLLQADRRHYITCHLQTPGAQLVEVQVQGTGADLKASEDHRSQPEETGHTDGTQSPEVRGDSKVTAHQRQTSPPVDKPQLHVHRPCEAWRRPPRF